MSSIGPWKRLWLAAAILAVSVPGARALTAVKASDDATSITGTNWTTPTNIRIDNGNYALYNTTTQDWLTVKTFGFAVPAGSVIDGIEVLINGQGGANAGKERRFDVSVTKDGTNPTGLLVTPADFLKNADSDVAVSTAGALWDLTWSAAEINSANFGIMIRDNNTTEGELRFDYMTVTVYYRTVDTVTLTQTAGAPATIAQGSEYAVQRFTAATDANTAEWTAVTVTKTGGLGDAFITDVRLYADTNTNGTYDSGTDVAISGANTFAAVPLAITLSAAETITTSPKTYFAVYTLAPLATNGALTGIQITSSADVTVTAPDLAALAATPLASGNSTVVDAADTVTVTRTDRAISVVQGLANVETQYLTMVTDNETASWTAITVKNLGSLPDSEITAVTIYDDSGGTPNQWDAGDLALSAGATFTSGSAAITLTVPKTITTTPQNFHIIYSLASDAALPGTIGSRVNAASDITLAGGVDLVAGTYPLDSTTPAVTDDPDIVTAAHTDFAVATILQGQQYAPMKFNLSTDEDEATWTAITVTQLGSVSDTNVDDVDIYLDTGNGTWGVEDTLVSAAGAEPFSGGSVALTLASPQTITTSAKTYHVVLKIAAGANAAHTIGARINAFTDITLSGGIDTVAPAGYPKDSSLTNIDAPGNTVTMTAPTSIAPGTADQGTANVGVLRFTLASSPGSASWTDIAVTKTGTLPDADITTVKIYRDDGGTPNAFDGTDTLISPAVTTFSGGGAAITLSAAESITTSAQTYLIVYTFEAFATTGTTVGAELTSDSALTITYPDIMSTSNFPGNSVNLTITDVADDLTVVPLSQAPASAVQGTSYSALRLRMSTDQDQALWTAITVNKTGTLADGDVTARIYRDANANGTYDSGTDTAISAATAFSAAAAAISLTANQTLTPASQDYFVVYTLSTLAVVGNTVDAQVSQNDITLAGGVDTKSAFTGDSDPTTVTDLGDTVTVTATDGANATVAQGFANLDTQHLSLATDAETAIWTAVTVTKTGTLADAGVSAVTIYDDSGGTPNNWDAGDAAISAGTAFSGGTAAITLTAPQTITTGAQVYHVVYSITTTATVGGTIGSRIAASTDLTLSGTDAVATGGYPKNSTNSTVTDTPDTVTETPTDTAPASIPQGGYDDFLKLSLATDIDEAVWTAITVTRLGTLVDAEVDSVMIYLDTGNGTFDAAEDTLISPAVTAFTGGVAAITLSAAQTLNTTPKVYFVVYDINNAATVTNTIGARIASEAALTVTAPDLKTAFTNHDSSIISIVAAPTITASRVDLSPVNVGQGADYATERLDLITDLGSADVTAVRVTLTGTTSRTNITAVKIFADTDGSGDYGPTDTLLGSGPFGGPGTVTITLSPAHTVTTTASSIFVAYKLVGTIPLADTVGASVVSGDITAAAPALVATTNFPLNSSNATVAAADYGLTVSVSLIDLGLLEPNTDTVIATPVDITNVGNLAQDYVITATTTTAGSPWVLSLSSGVDTFTIQALFNSVQPALTDFDDEDKLADNTPTLCTITKFVGDVGCLGVRPPNVRKLWFRIGMPQITSTALSQDVQITVSAQVP